MRMLASLAVPTLSEGVEQADWFCSSWLVVVGTVMLDGCLIGEVTYDSPVTALTLVTLTLGWR